MIGPGTAVLPLQNGVDAAPELVTLVGHAPVLGGLELAAPDPDVEQVAQQDESAAALRRQRIELGDQLAE